MDEETLEQFADCLRDMADGLETHPSICECRWDGMPPLFYSILRPAVQTIAQLRFISLETRNYIRPIDAAALRDVLQSNVPELTVDIKGHDFTDPESFQMLCDGVSTLGVATINIYNLKLETGAHQLADAILASNVRHMCLDWLACLHVDADRAAALATLRRQLPTMARLESIACDFTHCRSIRENKKSAADAREDIAAAVVRIAARCPTLEKLVIATKRYTRNLDKACFRCLVTARSVNIV